MTRYLTVDDVCRINEAEVRKHRVTNFGLVESAVFRPQQSVMGRDAYPDLHSKAAALFHAIANNHGFLEGNKRTAVLAVILFYNLNGWQVRVEQDQLVDFAVGAVVDHLDVPAIAKQLATWTLPFPP